MQSGLASAAVGDLIPALGSLLGVLVLLSAMLVLRGTLNLLFYLGAFFVFFSFGPVVNVILQNDVYKGTVLSEVGPASFGFFLAVLGIFVADLLLPQRSSFNRIRWDQGQRTYPLVAPVLSVLTVYGILAVSLVGPTVLAMDKHARIEAFGAAHRAYLFLEFCAVGLYFIARQSPWSRRLYIANVTIYIVYCFASSERDFVFVLFALLIVVRVVDGKRRALISLISCGLLLTSALVIVSLRSLVQVSFQSALNQGSVLFVDTFVRSIVPELNSYKYGATYVEALRDLLPGFAYSSTDSGLGLWLKDRYAAGSESGYGFSMTAEAYLNFGDWGIPVVFFVLALLYRWVTNRLDGRPAFGYYLIVLGATIMYAVRGDSAQLLQSLVYAILFYLCVSAVRGESIHHPRRPWVGETSSLGVGRGVATRRAGSEVRLRD